jgi:hypothetical protein
VLAADLNGDLVGIKLDNTLSTRERCFQGGEIQADCGLDMDFRDPTIMGRDPTFINGQFDPDPATGGPPFFRINSGIVNSGVRLARPVFWEKINTHTGRRYRDSFMPGSGTLSTQVMQRMYNVKVCEGPDPDISGNGLHGFGFAEGEGSTFLQDGNCVPFTELDPSSIGGERQAKHEPGDDAAKGDTTERVDAQPSAWSNLKPGVRAGERIRKRAPARRIGRPVPMSVNDAMCMTGATRALARSCQ